MINRLVNGLVLVLIGAVLLMNTTGYLPWSVWDAAITYWPILLIGLGIQLIFSKWQIPGIALAVIAALILAAVNPNAGLGGGGWRPRIRWMRPTPYRGIQSTKEWSYPLKESVSKIHLKLEAPSLDLEARGDSGLSAPSPQIAVSGQLGWEKYEPQVSATESGDAIAAVLKAPTEQDADAGKQDWNLSLNPSLVTSLDVSGGVASITFDASSAFLESLRVSSGVSSLDLKLGLSGKTTSIEVASGVGNVSIELPNSAGIKITLAGPLAMSSDFSNQGLAKFGNYWATPGYDSAETKVELKVSCGAGKVTLNWVDWE